MSELKGKIALVTGSNKAIGLATVQGLARLGLTVYLTSRDIQGGQAAAEASRSDGDVRYLHLDVTDEATMAMALAAVEAEHGRLDVLVNNAGITSGGKLSPLEVERSTIDRTLETNFFGAVRLTQLAVPLLKRSSAARIVNVSSSAGSFAYMSDPAKVKPFAYCLSKAALNAATVMFADALRGDGIKVNAACPGFVYSAVSAFQGTRTPEEGAEVIIHLATLPDDGPTGQFFHWTGPQAW